MELYQKETGNKRGTFGAKVKLATLAPLPLICIV